MGSTQPLFNSWGLQQPMQRTVAVLIILVYLTAAVALILTSEPQGDEAIYANPGYNLGFHGFMGTTMQESKGYIGTPFKTNRTYWQPPVYFVATALWFRAVGFDLLRVRSFSLLFGLVSIAAWYWFVYQLQESSWIALLAAALIATEYFFLSAAAHGRMEMMCVGLGASAFAVYVSFRKRSLKKAVLMGHCLVALAVFTHPASIVFFGGLLVLTVWLDWDRISLRTLPYLILLAGIPYLICGLAWGVYILQDPAEFLSQFRGIMKANVDAFNDAAFSSNYWIGNFQKEVLIRYVAPFGLGKGVSSARRLKALILIAYLAGMAGILGIKKLRNQRVTSIFPVLFILAFVFLAMASPSKFTYYLPYTTVMLAANLAVFLGAVNRDYGVKRSFVVLAAASIVGLQLAGTAYVVQQDPLRRQFLPTVEAVLQNSSPNSFVMAPQYFWFGFYNQPRQFLADAAMGALSGKHADIFVMDLTYASMHQGDKEKRPEVYRYLEEKIKKSRVVFQNDTYKVYVPLP